MTNSIYLKDCPLGLAHQNRTSEEMNKEQSEQAGRRPLPHVTHRGCFHGQRKTECCLLVSLNTKDKHLSEVIKDRFDAVLLLITENVCGCFLKDCNYLLSENKSGKMRLMLSRLNHVRKKMLSDQMLRILLEAFALPSVPGSYF